MVGSGGALGADKFGSSSYRQALIDRPRLGTTVIGGWASSNRNSLLDREVAEEQ